MRIVVHMLNAVTLKGRSECTACCPSHHGELLMFLRPQFQHHETETKGKDGAHGLAGAQSYYREDSLSYLSKIPVV